jgi:FMN phosphatase YigB (HAD superfamily)
VLFDVDGTLYRQAPLRALMAGELATVPWLQTSPWRVRRLWHGLSVFRHVREELRSLGRPDEPLDGLQYSAAADRAQMPVDELRAVVAEWILRRPLKYLRYVVRPGAGETLAGLNRAGMKIGVFSDYPVRDKLEALGLGSFVSLHLEATAPTVNAFKPHPRGFLAACEAWDLTPDEVLYVGDRVDIDGAGAAAAGMPSVIIGAQVRGLPDVLTRVAPAPAELD